jgi:hypothetical protein
MRKSNATEALCVAQEIDAIRTALKKRGYCIRKRPKQPVWSVYITPVPMGSPHLYQLTYQPAPISSWVLHPQNNDPCRHTLEKIIQNVLKKQPTDLVRRVS